MCLLRPVFFWDRNPVFIRFHNNSILRGQYGRRQKKNEPWIENNSQERKCDCLRSHVRNFRIITKQHHGKYF